jgi:histidine ammonia-lyase
LERIELDGQTLTPRRVVLLAQAAARARIDPSALARAAASASAAERIAARQPVYGRTTGVGANRTQRVADGDLEHGLRLLRSHAGGIGRQVSPEATRAMLAVRANQLLAGGAGLRAQIIESIVRALAADALPTIHQYGGLGTADLTALAELGLTLVGEAPWTIGAHHDDERLSDTDGVSTEQTVRAPDPIVISSGDALALISSSALTIGRACLAWHEAARWTDASHCVAALTVFALNGSTESFHEAVQERRPHPALMDSAARIRSLLAGQTIVAARIQDPYALRCIPQVHGAALEALRAVERVLRVEVNAAAENPLVVLPADRDAPAGIYHHGGFHQALLTQTLDALNLALLSVGQLSLARLDLTFHPEFTDLRPFLADGEPASSGVMILENGAHDALSELRNAAMPAGLGHATLSRGVEDHTPFTSQAARQTARAADALRLVLATELVAALRTLRLRRLQPAAGTPLARIYAVAEVLDPGTADRPSTTDVHLASSLLADLATAALVPGPAGPGQEGHGDSGQGQGQEETLLTQKSWLG